MTDLATFDPLPPPTETDRRLVRVYLRSRSEGASRRIAEWMLDRLARELGYADADAVAWTALGYEHGQYLLERIGQGIQPETTNTVFSALRGLVRQGQRARVIAPGSPCLALLDLSRLDCDTEEPAAGRALSDVEVGKLLAVCRADHWREAGVRDEAMIHALWATGFRRTAFCALDLADLDLDAATLTARDKGRKRHVMPLDADTLGAIRRYLEQRGTWAGPLWVATTPGRPPHHLTERRLMPASLYDMLIRRAVEAKVERFTPHDLRRTAVTDWIRRYGLRMAQRLANHSDPSQTARYDRSGREEMVEAVQARKLKLDTNNEAAPGA